jgi:hypothetical protein
MKAIIVAPQLPGGLGEGSQHQPVPRGEHFRVEDGKVTFRYRISNTDKPLGLWPKDRGLRTCTLPVPQLWPSAAAGLPAPTVGPLSCRPAIAF